MFALVEHEATLKNLNLRDEKHGEESVTAMDLELEAAIPNVDLRLLDSALLDLLFVKDEGDLASPEGVTRKLRCAKLVMPIKVEHELVGATVEVLIGTRAKNVRLDDCKVNKFRVTALEGGSCIVYFRVQCVPDEGAIAKLSMLLGHDVTITVEPPAAEDEKQGDLAEAGA